jgi:hypothetical protein
MHYTGPYRNDLKWQVRAAMTEIGLEPSERVEAIGRKMAHLQD